jgi:hypothetical protein
MDERSYQGFLDGTLIAAGSGALNTTLDNTAATLNGDGTVTLASTAHNFKAGSQIYIGGAAYYNGLQTLTAVAANSITFAVDAEHAFTPAGTETITITLNPATAFVLYEVRLHLSGAAAVENFTTTLDSGHGSYYDCVIDTVAMNGLVNVHRIPTRMLRFGPLDKLVFGWANGNAVTFGLEVKYGYLGG